MNWRNEGMEGQKTKAFKRRVICYDNDVINNESLTKQFLNQQPKQFLYQLKPKFHSLFLFIFFSL